MTAEELNREAERRHQEIMSLATRYTEATERLAEASGTALRMSLEVLEAFSARLKK